jgi:phospholipid-binding lipoprotein MlaA
MKSRAMALVTLAFCACASSGPTATRSDPFEPLNRQVFAFNEALDKAVLAPVARGYREVVPEFVRTSVNNFFGNLGDVWSTVNLVLEAKPQPALEMTMRVATNTVFGVGGLVDFATEMGLTRKRKDFGQTLGWWGVANGPYLVLPLFGPSTLRDTAAMPLDLAASPSRVFGTTSDRVGASTLQLIDTRAGLLSASGVLDQIALDKYSLIRDGWLARRRSQIYDGDPPDEPAAAEPDAESATPASAASAASSAASSDAKALPLPAKALANSPANPVK